ncbi:MAG: hypothetical protein M1819_004211 [Sarea resinae]|nr:MAG: hypothetical protein M1819_004211 [Sarea resinae]
MLGKIALEEAFDLPGQGEKDKREADLWIAPDDQERYLRQIVDINSERVRLADEHGIGYTIVSHTVPGIQGIADQAAAEKKATEVNNYVAEKIKAHPDKLGAFAALSLHDPAQAAKELRRAVRELGFHGALVNDYQHAGPKGETYLFYDQPAYDVFWETVQDLDVPVYIHPASPQGVLYEQLYAQRKFLVGPPLSFANGVSLHLLGLIINGVFDRFPRLKVIVGHLGEHIPFDFWRINHWFEDKKKKLAAKEGKWVWQKTIYDYFKRNIWVTTSGHFSTITLKYVADQIGVDRILFSVDYPYETIEDGCTWFDGDAAAIKEALGGVDGYRLVGRDNAKKVLKLDKYHDADALVV